MSFISALSDAYRRAAESYDRRGEREFLPAALEVIDTPPSPTGRALGLIIVLFFLVVIAWSFLGRVDIIATAPGHLLPAGDVKVIQPLDSGVVRAIHVQNGDYVRQGQLLIELDPTQAGADGERLAHDLIQAKLDVARLTALKGAMEGRAQLQLIPPPGADLNLVEEAKSAMAAQADEQAAKIADLAEQISQKDAEAAEVGAQTEKISASIPMLASKYKIYRDLAEKGYGSRLAYLDAQQQLSEAQHELSVQAVRAVEARDAKVALERQRDGAKSQYAAGVLGDLSKAQEQENELGQELVKAQNKSAQTELRSPINGVVDQLSVHTLNGVVTPAQHLMIVIPDSQNLLIEARLADGDVGFVHVGQAVKVKVETFNFTRYGLLDGRVVGVSRDVINDDGQQPPADPAGGVQQRANAPAYVARISLSKSGMMIDGRNEPLQPGMSVTAEIKTGNRTIMDYLLSPLARKAQESLHER